MDSSNTDSVDKDTKVLVQGFTGKTVRCPFQAYLLHELRPRSAQDRSARCQP